MESGLWRINIASVYGCCQIWNLTAKIKITAKKMPNCQTKSPLPELSKLPDLTYLAFRNASWQPEARLGLGLQFRLRPMSDTQESWATFSLNFVARQSCLGNCQFLADRTIGRAFGTLCRLSVVVCNVLYCSETVRPSEKVSEGVNRKPGSKSSSFGSPPYFYFRFRRHGPLDGRFLPYVLWRNGTS